MHFNQFEEPNILKSLSIVVPVYNEESTLPELRRRLEELLKNINCKEIEVILVSDGSTDNTDVIIKQISKENPIFKGIFLTRNFGHQSALSTGLRYISGDIVAVLDADLQDPPELLPDMLNKIRDGADVVYGVRQNRKENILKRIAYSVFYKILKKSANINIPEDSGDFVCMRYEVVNSINNMPENRRFIRGLRSWVGFRHVAYPYNRNARYLGEPKYNFRKLIRLAYDGFFTFSNLPIKLMQFLGFIVTTISFAFAFAYLIIGIINNTPEGFPTIIISIWFIGGIQLFFLGMIGEYIYRTFEQALNRPVALVREFIGFDEKE